MKWSGTGSVRGAGSETELETALTASPAPLRVEDIEALIRELGSIVAIIEQADPDDRAVLYESLGIAASYDGNTQTAVLQVEPAWGQQRVGGGTQTPSTRDPWQAWLIAV